MTTTQEIFQSMNMALSWARRVCGNDDGPWSVGVRGARGELLASAVLDSYAQVKAFAEAMEAQGFVHSILERHQDSHCCDFAFHLREDVAAGEELVHE